MNRTAQVKGTQAERPLLTPRGERTRAKLLEAAEIVFAERGFDEASIVAITAEAGVAMGTFYNYFPSKQAIFAELVRDLGHRMRLAMAAATEACSSRIEAEREGFRAFFEFTREHPGLYRILRSAEFVDRQAFRDHYDRLARGYIDGLRAAMADGEFREQDPETLAYFLMGIGDMVGMRWILWEDEGEVPEDVLDQLVSFVADGASAPRRGRRP